MIVGNKRYCDDCYSDNAQRYVIGCIVRDYCIECAIKHNLGL